MTPERSWEMAMSRTRGSRPARIASGLWLAICLLTPGTAAATNLATIVRKVGQVADDLPVDRLDGVAAELASSGATRRLLKRAGVPVDDAVERSRAVRRLLR